MALAVTGKLQDQKPASGGKARSSKDQKKASGSKAKKVQRPVKDEARSTSAKDEDCSSGDRNDSRSPSDPSPSPCTPARKRGKTIGCRNHSRSHRSPSPAGGQILDGLQGCLHIPSGAPAIGGNPILQWEWSLDQFFDQQQRVQVRFGVEGSGRARAQGCSNEEP